MQVVKLQMPFFYNGMLFLPTRLVAVKHVCFTNNMLYIYALLLICFIIVLALLVMKLLLPLKLSCRTFCHITQVKRGMESHLCAPSAYLGTFTKCLVNVALKMSQYDLKWTLKENIKLDYLDQVCTCVGVYHHILHAS